MRGERREVSLKKCFKLIAHELEGVHIFGEYLGIPQILEKVCDHPKAADLVVCVEVNCRRQEIHPLTIAHLFEVYSHRPENPAQNFEPTVPQLDGYPSLCWSKKSKLG